MQGSLVLPAGSLTEGTRVTLDFVPETSHTSMGRPLQCGLQGSLANSSEVEAARQGQDSAMLSLLVGPAQPPEGQCLREQEESAEVSLPNPFIYSLENRPLLCDLARVQEQVNEGPKGLRERRTDTTGFLLGVHPLDARYLEKGTKMLPQL